MKNQTFFEKRDIEANNFYLNAAGNDEDYAVGDNFYTAGKEFYANEPVSQRKSNSMPIIVICQNTATSTETAVELFDALNRYTKANSGLTGTADKVVITSGVQNISYQELLAFLFSGQVYEFAGVRITCTYATSDAIQFSDPDASITYQMKEPSGKLTQEPLNPTPVVFQFMRNIRDVKYNMLCNAVTSFKVSSISPSSIIKYEFYPKTSSSPSTELVRGDIGKTYGQAGLNQVNAF